MNDHTSTPPVDHSASHPGSSSNESLHILHPSYPGGSSSMISISK